VLRGDCAAQPRPCSWVGCRYHLGSGASESCALDVADRGDHDRAEVAAILGLSEDDVAEIEADAFEHASEVAARLGIGPEDLEMVAEAQHLAQAMDLGVEVAARCFASERRMEAVDELMWIVESIQGELSAQEKERVMEKTMELAAHIEGAAKLREREVAARNRLRKAQAEMQQVCAAKAGALKGLLELPEVIAFLELTREGDEEREEVASVGEQTDAGKLRSWLMANPGRTFTRQEICSETGVPVKIAAPCLSEWIGTLVMHPGTGVWISTAVRPEGEEGAA